MHTFGPYHLPTVVYPFRPAPKTTITILDKQLIRASYNTKIPRKTLNPDKHEEAGNRAITSRLSIFFVIALRQLVELCSPSAL